MRPIHLALLTLLFAPPLFAQQLIDFDPEEGPEAYALVLENFMVGSGNKAAKEAYANFNGLYFGGGFDEEQQIRIAATSVKLAAQRIAATGGFTDYLTALEGLAGSAEQPNELFGQFHDALDRLLAEPEVATGTILKVFNTTANFLIDGTFVPKTDDTGWRVIGGKPSFFYEDGVKLRIDTVRQFRAYGKKDTLNIQETDLTVDMANKRITGQGGRTDWQRAGIPPEVFAILVSYEVDPSRMLYTSDSAQLQYPTYFGDKILIGTFNDKIQPAGPTPNSEYPQFLSDDGYVEIKNIGKNITLFGNFELRGSTIYAIGVEGRQARVRLRIQGSATDRSVQGVAEQFVVRQGETIGGRNVRTTVHIGPDSLFHPSVSMRVKIPERVVALRRSDEDANRSPFYHSRNEMAIYSDFLDIHLDGDSAVIGKPSVSFQEKDDVIFESGDYYSEREYQFMQDIAATNPLERLYAYRQNMNGGLDDLHADDLAKSFRPEFTAQDIQPLLFELQTRGFLLYDTETKQILLKPKLMKYVEAFREERDYDRLQVVSRTKGTNAVMDMVTGEIRVNSVRPIEFNREKRIAIQPAGDELVINNNRDLDFDGTVYAGGLVITGKDFHYRYQPNHIELDSVRYVDIFLPADAKDAATSGERQSTASRIEHLSGYLLIDAPKNKSGTENLEYFPSLQSKDVSYIYYDKADTSAQYGRDDFHVALAPFSINGSDSLTAQDLALVGTVSSGGIFPDFEQTLTLQEDGSLGFTGVTPEDGRTTYEGRGSYAGELELNNGGLVGRGTLSYLEANIESDDIKFGLDGTTATTKNFTLEASSNGDRIVPRVQTDNATFRLLPYGDSLIVEAAEGAKFDLFEAGEHTLDGTLVLTPDALQANGTLEWSDAVMTSDDMEFTLFGASADTATVGIKATDGDDRLALETSGIAASFDFERGTADFETNTNELATQMPYNQFITSIKEFEWDMPAGIISFRSTPGKDRFTSTNPDQDSLTLTGGTATYDVNTNTLEIQDVPYIEVADARIYPGDGKVAIGAEASVQELTDARIVADTSNEYHVMKPGNGQHPGSERIYRLRVLPVRRRPARARTGVSGHHRYPRRERRPRGQGHGDAGRGNGRAGDGFLRRPQNQVLRYHQPRRRG